MKLDFNIGLGQRQGLALTVQVQQAIKLLQMTNLEVNEYIEENFSVNPLSRLKDKFLVTSHPVLSVLFRKQDPLPKL